MNSLKPAIATLAALKKSGYQSKSIKEELRSNLVQLLQEGKEPFEGVWGYENTVIPQLETAILSGHHINLLGLRGQAKTRLARLLITLLDEWMPIVKGSEVNDDPLLPLSRFAKDTLQEWGDATEIDWVHRSDRFAEKLATPDVTIADLIGDVDPIRAANLKLSYADERVIHFGMIPRSNRCLFVINELPDLQARIQVALFNILQEGDIQIRGFKLRFPLDIQFIFTANPEDYTNRGSIVTPLKDRIGSQILTHYPASIEIAQKITQQEARLNAQQKATIKVPGLAMRLIEQIGFEARNSEYIDTKSGISARISISAFENLMSTAELRMLKNGLTSTTVRLSDVIGIVPALTGKMEMAYEGEQEGAGLVAEILIEAAVKTIFESLFPKILKIEKQEANGPYAELMEWFENLDNGYEILESLNDKSYVNKLDIVALNKIILKYQPNVVKSEMPFLKEILLWGLAASKKISKIRVGKGLLFRDTFSDYLKNI